VCRRHPESTKAVAPMPAVVRLRMLPAAEGRVPPMQVPMPRRSSTLLLTPVAWRIPELGRRSSPVVTQLTPPQSRTVVDRGPRPCPVLEPATMR
jgi:hypothetical protein